MEEKRRSPRKASLARCVVDRLFAHDAPVPSRVINYSENGLMVELDYQLPRGEAIAVKLSPESVEADAYGSSICVGMVRWCDRQEGYLGACYGVGVELANYFPKRIFS